MGGRAFCSIRPTEKNVLDNHEGESCFGSLLHAHHVIYTGSEGY